MGWKPKIIPPWAPEARAERRIPGTFTAYEAEVSPGNTVKIMSKGDEKKYGIARAEEVKDRAIEAGQKYKPKPYQISEDTKRLHHIIKSNGISPNLIRHHPIMKKIYNSKSKSA